MVQKESTANVMLYILLDNSTWKYFVVSIAICLSIARYLVKHSRIRPKTLQVVQVHIPRHFIDHGRDWHWLT